MGTTRAAVDAMTAAGLGRWRGQDLVVLGYDVHGQSAYANIRRYKEREEPAQVPGEEPAQAPTKRRAELRGAEQSRSERSRADGPPDDDLPARWGDVS